MFCNNVTRFQMYGCCIRLWTSSKFAGYILHLWGCIRQMVRLLFSLLAVFVTLCVLVLTPVSINYLMFFWLIILIWTFLSTFGKNERMSPKNWMNKVIYRFFCICWCCVLLMKLLAIPVCPRIIITKTKLRGSILLHRIQFSRTSYRGLSWVAFL